jgi:hypothetical protein
MSLNPITVSSAVWVGKFSASSSYPVEAPGRFRGSGPPLIWNKDHFLRRNLPPRHDRASCSGRFFRSIRRAEIRLRFAQRSYGSFLQLAEGCRSKAYLLSEPCGCHIFLLPANDLFLLWEKARTTPYEPREKRKTEQILPRNVICPRYVPFAATNIAKSILNLLSWTF